MDDHDALYAAGRARQSGRMAPAGGGRSNGGRVAKAAYANADPPPMDPPPPPTPPPVHPPFIRGRRPTPADAVDFARGGRVARKDR